MATFGDLLKPAQAKQKSNAQATQEDVLKTIDAITKEKKSTSITLKGLSDKLAPLKGLLDPSKLLQFIAETFVYDPKTKRVFPRSPLYQSPDEFLASGGFMFHGGVKPISGGIRPQPYLTDPKTGKVSYNAKLGADADYEVFKNMKPGDTLWKALKDKYKGDVRFNPPTAPSAGGGPSNLMDATNEPIWVTIARRAFPQGGFERF